MYVYRGKLNWDGYAVNEALTIILPSNIDLGELVCVYWQWTTDDAGAQKKNESVVATINRVTRTDDEKSIRFFQDRDYRFDAVLGPDMETLDVTMSNNVGDNSSTILQLGYSDNTSIPMYHVYVGKLNWYWYAVDEMITVAVLSTFDKGDPVCVYWQWTVHSTGTKKGNADIHGAIDDAVETGAGKKIGFLYNNYYKFDGEVDEDGETMVLTMRNPNGDKSGPITLQLSSSVL